MKIDMFVMFFFFMNFGFSDCLFYEEESYSEIMEDLLRRCFDKMFFLIMKNFIWYFGMYFKICMIGVIIYGEI